MRNNDIIPGFDKNEKDDSFLINLDYRNEVLILHMKGNLDYHCSNELSKKIDLCLEKSNKIVMNVSNVGYMSSIIIGTLVSAFQKCKKSGGSLVFVGMRPKIYEIFQLLGFATFFHFEESVNDAINLINKTDVVEEKIFPKVISCPICKKRLKASKSGIFRCPKCKTILKIDDKGLIYLG